MNFKGNRKAPQYAEDITLDEKVKTLPPDSIIAIAHTAARRCCGRSKSNENVQAYNRRNDTMP